MNGRKSLGFVAVLLCLLAARVKAAGQEGFGNAPLEKTTGLGEPVLSVANLTSRVYWREVNGDYHFFFQGEIAEINAALQAFAAIAKEGDVIIRPGSGRTESFEGKPVEFTFSLHGPGGLAVKMMGSPKTDEGRFIFDEKPTLTIYVGEGAMLDRLEIPQRLTILELKDLRDRYAAGLNKKSPTVESKPSPEQLRLRNSTITVRAQSAVELGTLDAIAAEVIEPLRKALGDPELYVRLCAIDALSRVGQPAKSAIMELEAIQKNAKDDREKESAGKALEAIRKAKPQADVTLVLERIHRLKAGREK